MTNHAARARFYCSSARPHTLAHTVHITGYQVFAVFFALGFWSGRVLATRTAWASFCLVHHNNFFIRHRNRFFGGVVWLLNDDDLNKTDHHPKEPPTTNPRQMHVGARGCVVWDAASIARGARGRACGFVARRARARHHRHDLCRPSR